MTPKGLLAVSVLVVCLGISFVAVIDAGEPGHTLDAVSTSTIGAVIATISAASIGVVVGNRLLGTSRRETPESEESEETEGE